MRRRVRLALCAACAAAGCLAPTEGCGCTPMVPMVVAFGAVRTAAGAPAVGARVEVRASAAPCAADAAASPFVARGETAAGGAYRVTAVTATAGATCVHVRAVSGADTATAAGVGTAAGPALDSVRVDLRFAAR